MGPDSLHSNTMQPFTKGAEKGIFLLLFKKIKVFWSLEKNIAE